MSGNRIALFGGSFDPIHLGHLTVAQDSRKQLSAEKIVFIPAKRSPHKKNKPKACDRDRLEMILLAIAGSDEFEVSECELTRPEPSYSLDTVRYFRQLYGDDAHLYWLIGADAVRDLHKWYHADEFLDECSVCIMNRGGVEIPDFGPIKEALGQDRAAKLKRNMISTPSVEISSTEVRRRVRDQEPLNDLVPSEVAEFIANKGLYR
ncbi:Nicotinate-nucleotide adenylyltransferase [Anaerohalosphaera lusitana]|uniref:Probable nicotinate-nucleotide adenylyltransferase n=1 Tax=Anaerohalosphaera lusitana TaxID=1936003 RepID=A0A1U9NNM2_9BACT|nr:nicotinate-nucleotide adenylyltransferase [Anaerohalosphaera lusitana]AQT69397.1 Nicotinate-nucleotide adenylyltransferase [Anaerohalosphaera lusitana]